MLKKQVGEPKTQDGRNSANHGHRIRRITKLEHFVHVELAPDRYNFEELDSQVRRAEEVGAPVILAVGRRLPPLAGVSCTGVGARTGGNRTQRCAFVVRGDCRTSLSRQSGGGALAG
jgi:hypothetical protein